MTLSPRALFPVAVRGVRVSMLSFSKNLAIWQSHRGPVLCIGSLNIDNLGSQSLTVELAEHYEVLQQVAPQSWGAWQGQVVVHDVHRTQAIGCPGPRVSSPGQQQTDATGVAASCCSMERCHSP